MNTTSGTTIFERALHTAAQLLGPAFAAVMLILLPAGCHNAELWEKIPQPVTEFLAQYFPSSELQSADNSDGIIHVRINNGPELIFDSNNQWISVNGHGVPLPEVFLFDQMPPKVYSYLQETEQLNAVFAVTRDSKTYTLTLLNNELTYDIGTAGLHGSTPA